MLGLIRTNLIRRPARTLLTALGIGVGVATIVALLSLTRGLQNTANGLVHLGGADFGVFQSGVADPTTSVLPESFVRRVERFPGVSRATPLMLITGAVAKDQGAIGFGADPRGFFAQRLLYASGHAAAPGQVVVGDSLASELHLHVGQTLAVKGRPFPIAGIYHSGIQFEDGGLVMPMSDAQTLLSRPREETLVVVGLTPGAHHGVMAALIPRRFPGTMVIGDAEEASRAGANSVLITNAILAFVVVALIVGGISVTNTMAMAIVERQAELALLSTVGWSASRVALLILGEGVCVSIIGAAIGLLLGVVGSDLLVKALAVGDYVTPSITAWGLGRGLLVGVAIGVLGGVYPSWRVTRMRPLKALARG